MHVHKKAIYERTALHVQEKETVPFSCGQMFGAVGSSDLIFAQASLVTWTSSDDSPFLILHGDQIQVVPLLLYRSLYDYLVAAWVTHALIPQSN